MKYIGGQALIDGIIMMGKKCTAIVRRKSSGRINVETKSERTSDSQTGIYKVFLVRGMANFFRTFKQMIINLEFYDKNNSSDDQSSSKFFSKNKSFTIILGVLFFAFLFFVLPEFLVSVIPKITGKFLISLFKFVFRIIVILIYIGIISINKDFQKILRYHGAEHKVINCYERKDKLTIENVKNSSRLHKRCGTNLIFYVVLFYFIAFSFLPRFDSLTNVLIELVLFLIGIGFANEMIEYMARSDGFFSSVLFNLSKGIQVLTTREPEDDEIEVAIVSLKVCEGLKVKNTIKELFLMGRGILRDAGIESYALDSRLILEYCIGVTPTEVFTSEVEVSKEDEENYLKLIGQRKNGKPIAYMIGKKEFYGNDFTIKEGVLIPRADTEVLVENALKILNQNQNYTSICDLCCGSGAVGISIQKNNLNVNCTYVDKYEIPLKVTEENIYVHDLKNRSYIVKSDLLEFFIENDLELDGIISNPPYIKSGEIKNLMKDVKDFEPCEALDGGEDGLDYYRNICTQARKVLIENGFLAFEIPYNKAFDIMYIMTNNNFVNIDIYKDINDNDRVIVGFYRSKL